MGWEAIDAKQTDGQFGAAVVGEIGEDFADDRRELETMSGETRRQRHVWMLWVQIDDEVTIGCQRVNTHGRAAAWTIDHRQMFAKKSPRCLFVFQLDRTLDLRRRV